MAERRLNKRVVVVDGSNEIAGDGAVPHSCIGRARRMPVPAHTTQAAVALEAVQNHNPEVSDCTLFHLQCCTSLPLGKDAVKNYRFCMDCAVWHGSSAWATVLEVGHSSRRGESLKHSMIAGCILCVILMCSPAFNIRQNAPVTHGMLHTAVGHVPGLSMMDVALR